MTRREFTQKSLLATARPVLFLAGTEFSLLLPVHLYQTVLPKLNEIL